MRIRVFSVAVLVCAMATLLVTRFALAADSEAESKTEIKTATFITIDGMHCPACAKKVAKKLEAVKYVASAKIDVKTGKATVVPAKEKTVSAKLLWEAVETAGYTPTKLESPTGTFTKKPKS